MTILLLVIAGLATVHFIYQALLLPSIRLSLRYRMFELRDKLRDLADNPSISLDPQAYKYMQGSINITIVFLYRIDFLLLLNAYRAFNKHPNLRKQAEKRLKVIKSCKTEEVQVLNSNLSRLLICALLANSGGLLPFLFAFLLLIFTISQLKKRIWDRTRDFILDITCIPEDDARKVIYVDSL